MTIGTGSSYLLVLELVGKAEPRVVLKILTPGGVPIIGIGVQQVWCCFGGAVVVGCGDSRACPQPAIALPGIGIGVQGCCCCDAGVVLDLQGTEQGGHTWQIAKKWVVQRLVSCPSVLCC